MRSLSLPFFPTKREKIDSRSFVRSIGNSIIGIDKPGNKTSNINKLNNNNLNSEPDKEALKEVREQMEEDKE